MARINTDVRVKEALSATAEVAHVFDRLKHLLDNHDDQLASKFRPTLVSENSGNKTCANRINDAKRCSSHFSDANDSDNVDD
ncbi:hypothetical protein P3L10_023210 [Capsicum annuum]